MSKALLVLMSVVTLSSIGCAKKVSTNVAGTDDEQLDQYASQLEELRTRVEANAPACDEWCSLSRKVCDISKNVCEISKRHVDRADIQQKCVSSQEDCAHFNDSCASCR